MKSQWNPTEAAACENELSLRVYTSRLLGSDPTLVLHGGGNTSVKIVEPDLFGEDQQILYVKGSGWDLASIEAPGFTPVRMDHLLRLAQLESLSDSEMVNQLKTHQTLASAPTPSVEAILHAVLPYKYVDHTHADAIITLTNTPQGEQRIRELYQQRVVVIPYVMPGFDLARTVAEQFSQQANDQTLGMVLMNHGIFSFGDDARQSYERMIQLVDEAEQYLQKNSAWEISPQLQQSEVQPQRLARLRKEISDVAGTPMILQSHRTEQVLSFCQRADLEQIASRGPATPDHVLRTKQLPMIGCEVIDYVGNYQRYFEQHAPLARTPVEMLDPAPRVVLDPDLGMLSVGKNSAQASIVADIYRHTMSIIQRAEMLDQWQALSSQDIFDVEYWELEQAKLRKAGSAPAFQGEVALITGAASGIGKACAASMLQRGAAVVGLDRNPAITQLFSEQAFLGIQCDVTDTLALQQALSDTCLKFGGLDMLVLNAGIFPSGCDIAELEDANWRQVMQVNLDANLALLRESHPYLKSAARQGRVVVIGSKNVPAPGQGAAAYSASKAALNQLARIIAMEWARDNIRINSLHPDAVFDTGIWTPEVLEIRAKHYDLSVEAYKKRNLLGCEITSHDVAELVAELCDLRFSKTTGAQIPIDGGNDRVI
ncbi:MAG: bifunctional aldolase/short-chain dehydrogenase [Candidatus Thiodiazotropha lotti]|uniref:Bifunctional aldolase/short-chain dehydrogenase n=1 Tax=Candidatus Thiodiazotropha lotti TaxID=2792787 RepID=A0A9E4N2D1_9GAMM|nr:bifunctional aldolase/short-chain dehydrogenase [Candidatus Thiodiazotropha lotti]ODC01276.1 short-chain dehydrogenase [Candidatus Thiodiazotropha endoloripes]MCG7940715.1 bifunctional aldolase/short-chain dehydrogenase [Candidatus Thiodiazotropha lotti]MCG7988897.1 bifunctional aldolase/short-chain dehydrogenase [Candidatus Thiodiazotropha lotti]MCG8020328.1 bifunctional aldolase/short-chain dehydrogenase [Candidatus Thiodiazotropha lotti]